MVIAGTCPHGRQPSICAECLGDNGGKRPLSPEEQAAMQAAEQEKKQVQLLITLDMETGNVNIRGKLADNIQVLGMLEMAKIAVVKILLDENEAKRQRGLVGGGGGGGIRVPKLW